MVRSMTGYGLMMALALVAAPVQADDGDGDALGLCLEKVGDGDRGPCFTAEYKAQDARLNAAYKKLAASLAEGPRKTLRDEEREWIAKRDQQCGKAVDTSCAQALTRDRATVLELRTGVQPVTFQAIKGRWGYSTDCNLGHTVGFEVEKDGPVISGTWSDGTHATGWQGQFRGRIADGRLYFAMCYEDDPSSQPQCPTFPDHEESYMQLQAGKLVWVRGTGDDAGTPERYVTLQRLAKNADVPKDAAVCPGDADEGDEQ